MTEVTAGEVYMMLCFYKIIHQALFIFLTEIFSAFAEHFHLFEPKHFYQTLAFCC